MLKRTVRLVVLGGAGVLVAALGCSKDPQAPTGERSERAALNEYNLPDTQVALAGYSPVSYFAKGVAERGTTPFVVSHRGIHYKFTSPTQMNRFKADAGKYEPAYGGWCAFGMAANRKDPPDPTHFKIVNGRLLLFAKSARSDALELWNRQDERELTASADQNWNNISGE